MTTFPDTAQLAAHGASVRFPDTPDFSGFSKPSRLEIDICGVEVEGTIPAELNGTFYRVGPDPQWPPLRNDDVFFNGDGMVSYFRIENGQVDFKSRYVRTEKYKLERAAHRALFGLYRNPYTDDPSVAGKDRNTANTTPIWHGGRLLVLKEDSRPIEVDPDTLETIGTFDYDGKLSSPTHTAHTKTDPLTGELVFYGSSAKGLATPDVAYYEADAKGNIIHEAWLQMPYAGVMHDFAVTSEHVLFIATPTVSILDRIKKGESYYFWDGTRDCHVAVMPRKGTAKDIRWFRKSARSVYHFMNAQTVGSKVLVDGCVAEANQIPPFPNLDGTPWDPKKGSTQLVRWTFDLSKPGEDFRQEVVWPHYSEMPRVDSRYETRGYRYGYFGYYDRSRPLKSRIGPTGNPMSCVSRIDYVTGKVSEYYTGETCSTQEAIFIPRSKNAAEGEGYLLSVINHFEEMRSDLVILDAQNLEAGPIATARMPVRLRYAFHGNWVNKDERG